MFKFPRLLPKEDNFCAMLNQLSVEARNAARHLQTFVESENAPDRARAAEAITASKGAAKKITTDITRELCRSFITPFDREDIQDLASNLYKIPKTIEKIKDRLSLHDIAAQGGDFSRQVVLIVQEADAMEDMIRELTTGKNNTKVVARANILQELEHKGDAILGELLVSLFKDNTDTRDLILRKDIYDMLERVIDRYRDASDVALQIVLKHS